MKRGVSGVWQRGLLLFLFLPVLAAAQDVVDAPPVTVNNIRYHYYPAYTRVVVDFNQPPTYRVEPLDGASRSRSLAIYLPNAVLAETLKDQPILLLQGQLEKIEVRDEDPANLTLLLNLKAPGEYKAMVLTHPDRLVLDVMYRSDETTASATPPPQPPSPPNVLLPPAPLPPAPSLPPTAPEHRATFGISTIVLDPGHGGDSPGAIGPTGLTEAEVVLDVSLRVKELIEQRLRKKVILTRDQDVFIPLSERTKIANDQKADLFVSIHANASTKRSAHGIETYMFGRATNKEALETAARENATDVKTAQKIQDVILNDLLRDFTINESLTLAHYTQEAFVNEIITEYPTKSLGVKKAPFYVLAHTEMPAILAEISFVSNPMEEERLRQGSYRQKVAESIFQGIRAYIQEKQ